MYVYNTFSQKYIISSPHSNQDILVAIKMVEGIFCFRTKSKEQRAKIVKNVKDIELKKAEPEIMIVGTTLSGFRQLSLTI